MTIPTQEEIERQAKKIWYGDPANDVDWPFNFDRMSAESKEHFYSLARGQLTDPAEMQKYQDSLKAAWDRKRT